MTHCRLFALLLFIFSQLPAGADRWPDELLDRVVSEYIVHHWDVREQMRLDIHRTLTLRDAVRS